MKVLFLDVDGVINSSRSCLVRGKVAFSQQALAAQKKLREKHADEDGALPYGVQETIDTIDPVAVSLVNQLFSWDSDLKLVLSTSHRSMFTSRGLIGEHRVNTFGTAEHIADLDLYMKSIGIEADVFSVTPVLYTKRGVEVQTWLDEHPSVSHHAILDDSADFFLDQPLVLCSGLVGFASGQFFKTAQLLDINVIKGK